MTPGLQSLPVPEGIHFLPAAELGQIEGSRCHSSILPGNLLPELEHRLARVLIYSQFAVPTVTLHPLVQVLEQLMVPFEVMHLGPFGPQLGFPSSSLWPLVSPLCSGLEA